MIEDIPESRVTEIKLPGPDLFSLIFMAAWGAILAFGGLNLLTDASRGVFELCVGALFLAAGTACLALAIYSFFSSSSIIVDLGTRTISFQPSKPILHLDQATRIDVWRATEGGRSPRYRWVVNLAFANGQEIEMWQGYSRDKARWLAQELSNATGKPWIGGSKATK